MNHNAIKTFLKKNMICIGCFVVVFSFYGVLLLNNNPIWGDDTKYHVLRLKSLIQQMEDNAFFQRINYVFYNGAGYASSLCYPDVFLYIPACICSVFNVPIGLSFNLFILVCVGASWITAYICWDRIFENKYAAAIAATMYVCSLYFLHDIFKRVALGEIQAMVFLPLCIWGLYDVLHENLTRPIVIIIGFSGLLLSHTITTMLMIVLWGFVLLINIKVFIAEPKRIIYILKVALWVLGLTAFWWMPFLEQYLLMDLAVENSISYAEKELNSLFESIQLTIDYPVIGISAILLCIPRFFLSNVSNRTRFGDACFWGTAVMVFCTTTLAETIWSKVRFLGIIQFPWRLLILATILICCSVAAYFERILEKLDKKRVAVIAVLIIMYFAVYGTVNNYAYLDMKKDYYGDVQNTMSVGYGEWLPEEAHNNYTILANRVSEQKAVTKRRKVIDDIELQKGVATIRLTEKFTDEYIDVPLIYYKGYVAVLKDLQGNTSVLRVDGEGIAGLCRVYTEDKCGDITVYYAGTIVQNISAITSVLTFFVLLKVLILGRKKHEKFTDVCS